MTIEQFIRTLGKFQPTDGTINIALDLQNVRLSHHPDDFITTMVVDIKADTLNRFAKSTFTGTALLSSNNELKAEGWQDQPGKFHYHYAPVIYSKEGPYWELQ